jgi:hypothetical protein
VLVNGASLTTTGGEGAAVFAANNSTTLLVTASTPVQIQIDGVTGSSISNNIRLTASVGGQQRQTNLTVRNPYLHADGQPAGNCGSVTRGQSITAILEDAAGLQNIVWQFTNANASLYNQNQGNTTWAGTMVLGGTIRVEYTGGFRECTVTVNSRDWTTTRPMLMHPEGAPNGTYTTFPSPIQQAPDPNAPEVPLGGFWFLIDSERSPCALAINSIATPTLLIEPIKYALDRIILSRAYCPRGVGHRGYG